MKRRDRKLEDELYLDKNDDKIFGSKRLKKKQVSYLNDKRVDNTNLLISFNEFSVDKKPKTKKRRKRKKR